MEVEGAVVPHDDIDALKGLVDSDFVIKLLLEGPKSEYVLRGSIRGIKTHRNEPPTCCLRISVTSKGVLAFLAIAEDAVFVQDSGEAFRVYIPNRPATQRRGCGTR